MILHLLECLLGQSSMRLQAIMGVVLIFKWARPEIFHMHFALIGVTTHHSKILDPPLLIIHYWILSFILILKSSKIGRFLQCILWMNLYRYTSSISGCLCSSTLDAYYMYIIQNGGVSRDGSAKMYTKESSIRK